MSIIERFNFYAKKDRGCWEWTGPLNGYGYGRLFVGGHGRFVMAHRYSYERFIGKIAQGLTLDHLCRVRHCVKPKHLEAVTNRENIRRGESPFAKKARLTRCIHGHRFDKANTYIKPNGTRHCRSCGRIRDRARYLKYGKRVKHQDTSRTNRR